MPSVRPPFLARALLPLTVVLLAGCHGGRGARIPEAALREPALGTMPIGTDVVLHLDVGRLTAHPAYVSLRGDALALGEAMQIGACGPDPFAALASITLGHDAESGDMLVLRGRADAPSAACADAWASALLDGPRDGRVTVGPFRAYARRDRVAGLRAVLEGDASTVADDPANEAVRPVLRDAAVALLVDLDALSFEGLELPPVIGLDAARARAVLESAEIEAFGVELSSPSGLAFTSATSFGSDVEAEDARALASRTLGSHLMFARAAVLSLPAALDLPDMDTGALLGLAGAVDTVAFRAERNVVVTTAGLDASQLTTATTLLGAAFRQHARSLQGR